MLFKYTTVLALHLASIALARPGPVYRTDTEAYNYTQDVEKLKVYAQTAYDQSRAELLNGTDIGRSGNCSLSNVRVRKEWYDIFNTGSIHPYLPLAISDTAAKAAAQELLKR